MKICTRCSLTKSLDSFSKRGDTLQTYCKKCNSLYLKEHYKKNKEYYINKSKNYRNKLKDIIREIKAKATCKDCDKHYHYSQMQFDHLRDKNFTISSAVGAGVVSMKVILEEIDKCEIVCANCHAFRTWSRRQI